MCWKIHTPTGKRCRVMRDRGDGTSFCDFFNASNPFTSVNNSELRDMTDVERGEAFFAGVAA